MPTNRRNFYDFEETRKLRSTDYVAYNENLRKKVSPSVLVDKISEHNDQFFIPNLGLVHVLERELRKYLYRNLYNEELVIYYLLKEKYGSRIE